MFEGWTIRRLSDGVGLFPPGGPVAGCVRIRDRRRPLRSVRAIRDRALAAIGNARSLGSIERLATREGELAAITTTGLEVGEHTLGVIFGDDFYTQIDVFSAAPSSFEHDRSLARSLVSRYAIGLGHERMRRSIYRPPDGWSGYPRGLATIWYPPGFPANRTAITASPAVPIARPADLLSELIAQRATVTPRPLATTPILLGGLQGACAHTDLGDVGRVQIELRDERFRYAFQLDCPSAEMARYRPVLDALLASLEPIPQPAKAPVDEAFAFWTA